jgi:hypothetical protein
MLSTRQVAVNDYCVNPPRVFQVTDAENMREVFEFIYSTTMYPRNKVVVTMSSTGGSSIVDEGCSFPDTPFSLTLCRSTDSDEKMFMPHRITVSVLGERFQFVFNRTDTCVTVYDLIEKNLKMNDTVLTKDKLPTCDVSSVLPRSNSVLSHVLGNGDVDLHVVGRDSVVFLHVCGQHSPTTVLFHSDSNFKTVIDYLRSVGVLHTDSSLFVPGYGVVKSSDTSLSLSRTAQKAEDTGFMNTFSVTGRRLLTVDIVKTPHGGSETVGFSINMLYTNTTQDLYNVVKLRFGMTDAVLNFGRTVGWTEQLGNMVESGTSLSVVADNGITLVDVTETPELVTIDSAENVPWKNKNRLYNTHYKTFGELQNGLYRWTYKENVVVMWNNGDEFVKVTDEQSMNRFWAEASMGFVVQNDMLSEKTPESSVTSTVVTQGYIDSFVNSGSNEWAMISILDHAMMNLDNTSFETFVSSANVLPSVGGLVTDYRMVSTLLNKIMERLGGGLQYQQSLMVVRLWLDMLYGVMKTSTDFSRVYNMILTARNNMSYFDFQYFVSSSSAILCLSERAGGLEEMELLEQLVVQVCAR